MIISYIYIQDIDCELWEKVLLNMKTIFIYIHFNIDCLQGVLERDEKIKEAREEALSIQRSLEDQLSDEKAAHQDLQVVIQKAVPILNGLVFFFKLSLFTEFSSKFLFIDLYFFSKVIFQYFFNNACTSLSSSIC